MRPTKAITIGSLLLVAIVAESGMADHTQQQRTAAVEWLQSYVGDELLLKPEDLAALIDNVGQMSDAEFQTWYQQTRPLREVLQSPEWQETRAWLREFLAVQAIYSEEQIDEFRSKAAEMSPREMLEAVRRIQRRHRSMVSMHASSQRSREMNLSMQNELMLVRSRPAGQVTGSHSEGLGRYHGNASPGPVRASYAQRMNVYRRPFYYWYGFGGLLW